MSSLSRLAKRPLQEIEAKLGDRLIIHGGPFCKAVVLVECVNANHGSGLRPSESVYIVCEWIVTSALSQVSYRNLDT